MTRRLKPARYG